MAQSFFLCFLAYLFYCVCMSVFLNLFLYIDLIFYFSLYNFVCVFLTVTLSLFLFYRFVCLSLCPPVYFSLYVCLIFSVCLFLFISVYLSFSRLSFFISFLPVSLSLSHTHTHKHTHTRVVYVTRCISEHLISPRWYATVCWAASKLKRYIW